MDVKLTFQKCSTLLFQFYALLHTIQNEVMQPVSFHLDKFLTRFCCINQEVKKMESYACIIGTTNTLKLAKILIIHFSQKRIILRGLLYIL